VAPERASHRPLQIIVNDLAQPQGKVCADVNRGHDLENRQIGHVSQGVRHQGEGRGSGPRPFQNDLLKVVFDKLTDARSAVDVRNDLEKEVRLLESRLEQFERRARLVSTIARGRQWLDDVVSGRVTTVAELCVREKCSVRQVNMTISLAFLAPNLVKAAVEGRLPRGVGVERLRDPPTEWSRQFEALGLNPE